MPSLPLQLKALADGTRLEIIKMLLNHDLCAGAIASRLGISRAAVSQHMKVLREANLVTEEKRGYWTHYEVDCSELNRVAEELSCLADQGARSKHPCFRFIRNGKFINQENLEERRVKEMCKCCCEHPEKLKGKPEDCSPEQIKECHGDSGDHPCVSKKEE